MKNKEEEEFNKVLRRKQNTQKDLPLKNSVDGRQSIRWSKYLPFFEETGYDKNNHINLFSRLLCQAWILRISSLNWATRVRLRERIKMLLITMYSLSPSHETIL